MATKGLSLVILACITLSVWSAGLKSFTIRDNRDYNEIDYKISMNSLNSFSIEYTARNTVPSPDLYVVDAFDRVFESSKATRLNPSNTVQQGKTNYTYDLSSKCAKYEKNVGTPGVRSFCTVFIQLRTASYSTMYYPIDIEFTAYFDAELYPGGEEWAHYSGVYTVSSYLFSQSRLDNLFDTRDDCTYDAYSLYYGDLKIKTRSSPPGSYQSKYIVWTCPLDTSSSRITVQTFSRRFPLVTSDCASYPSVSYSMYSRSNCKANIVFETGNSLLSTNIFNQTGYYSLKSYQSNYYNNYQTYQPSRSSNIGGILTWLCCGVCCIAIIGGICAQRRKNYMQPTLVSTNAQAPLVTQPAQIIPTPTLHQSGYPIQMVQAYPQQPVYQPQPSYYPQPTYQPQVYQQQQVGVTQIQTTATYTSYAPPA